MATHVGETLHHHGRRPPEGGAVTQFPPTVTAPGHHGSILLERQCMVHAGGHGHHVLRSIAADRSGHVDHRVGEPGAERRRPSPTPQRSITLGRHDETGACGHRTHIGQCVPRKWESAAAVAYRCPVRRSYSNPMCAASRPCGARCPPGPLPPPAPHRSGPGPGAGCMKLNGSAVASSPDGPKPPGQQHAVAPQGDALLRAGGDGDGVVNAGQLRGYARGLYRQNAQASAAAVAPDPDGAVVLQGQGMGGTGRRWRQYRSGSPSAAGWCRSGCRCR